MLTFEHLDAYSERPLTPSHCIVGKFWGWLIGTKLSPRCIYRICLFVCGIWKFVNYILLEVLIRTFFSPI